MSFFDKYRTVLNARVETPTVTVKSRIVPVIAELTPHLDSEQQAAVATRFEKSGFTCFVAPGIHVSDRCHGFGLRAGASDIVHLYHIGVFAGGSEMSLEGLDYKDFGLALDFSKTMWKEHLRPLSYVATFALHSHNRPWPHTKLCGRFNDVKAEHVPPSVFCSLGAVECVSRPAEMAEVGKGLESDNSPSFVFCGDCGLSFRDGKCTYCNTPGRLTWESMLGMVAALPPMVWRGFVEQGHTFKLDQRVAYIFEYQSWIGQISATLPVELAATCTRNQRTVVLGNNDAIKNS